MRWVWAIALAGCGFTHGDLLIDAPPGTGDGSVDAPIDTARPTCIDKWLTGTIRFDTPIPIPNVSAAGAFDRDPFLPADELTLYFSTGRGGDADVWYAKRTAIDDTFSPPEEASEFNSTSNDGKLSISADNKIAVINSDRPGSSGNDVWEVIRLSATDQWPAMNRTNVMMIGTGNEYDPLISADGARIYFSSDTPGPQHILRATRTGNGTFGQPVTLTQLSGGNGDADPALSPDERIIVFASQRALGGGGGGDIWYATRSSTSAAFGTPQPVPDLFTAVPEGDPHLSSDGCRMYFSRALANFDFDLYVAVAQ